MQNITQTAQALSALGTLNIPALLALLASMLVAAAASPALQASVEGIIAGFIPAPLFFIKPFLPSVISGFLGSLAIHLGVAPDDAAAGALALASTTHWVNKQGWAEDLESKVPKVWTPILKALGLGTVAKSATLLLCLLGAAALAHADTTTTAAASVTVTSVDEIVLTIQPVIAQPGLWIVESDGYFQKDLSSVLDGADLVVGKVCVTGTEGTPQLFGGLGAGVLTTSTGLNRGYVRVTAGYWYGQASAAYDGQNLRLTAGLVVPWTLRLHTYKVLP